MIDLMWEQILGAFGETVLLNGQAVIAIFNDDPVEIELDTGAVVKARNPRISFYKEKLPHPVSRGDQIERFGKKYEIYSIEEKEYEVLCELHTLKN